MKQKSIFLIILLVLPFIGFTQDGSPDLSFGDNGIVITDINDNDDTVYAVAQAPSGRIIVAGLIFGAEYQDFIIAYLEDGTIDNSFGNNGVLISESENGEINDVIVQEDEKIIIGKGYNNNFTITRHLSDGSIDNSYGDEGFLSPLLGGETKKAIVLTQEGKILLCGYDSNQNFILKRFLQNGELDIEFGVEGTISYAFGEESYIPRYNIQLMEDGSFVIGLKIIDTGVITNIMVKFHEDGSMNTSYGTNGVIPVPVEELFTCSPLVFANGDTLARCEYWDVNSDMMIRTTIKYHPDGSIDFNFGNAGYMQGYIGEIIQANQRILHASRYYDWEGGQEIYLSRLFADGSLDPSFIFSGSNFIMGPAHVLLLNSGKVLIAGSNVWYDWPVNIILQQYNNDPLGIEDHQLEQFSIYPNPSNGIFNINHDFINSTTPYQITDITGKVIQTGKLTSEQSEINLSEMQSGMYLITASGSTFRLVKN